MCKRYISNETHLTQSGLSHQTDCIKMNYNLSDKGLFFVALEDTPEHFNINDALDVVKDFNPQSAIPVEGNKWIVSLKTRNDVEKAIRQGQIHYIKEEEECIIRISEYDPGEILEEWNETKAENDETVDQSSGQAATMPDSDERVELRTVPPSVQTSASSDPANTWMSSRQQSSYPPNTMNLQHGSYNPTMHQYPFGYEKPPMESPGMNTSQQKNENPVPQFQQSAHYGFQQHVHSFVPPGAGIPYSQHPHQHPDQFYSGPGQQPFPPHGHPPYFAPQFPGYPPNYHGSPYQQGGSYYQPYSQISRLDQSQNPNDESVSLSQHKSPSQSAAKSKHQDNADEAQLKTESVLQEQAYVQHQKKQDTSSTRKDDEKKQYKEEEPVLTAKSRKLKVSNVPYGVSDDALELFFENEKRSGGGEVKSLDFDPDSSTAVIEFEDPSVIDRVLQRLPLAIQGKQLKIEVCKEADKLEKVVVDEDEHNDLPKTTVVVRGFSEDTSADALEMYFENKKRSGGGPISNIEWKDKVALITFESEAATNEVLKKRHKLSGRDLDVKLYVPPKPVPMYQDKLLITGLNEKITKDCLTNFLEARSGSSPAEILYSQDDEQKALVTFESPPDLQKLKEACQKRKLEGAILEVSQVPISRCVLVTNLAPKTSEDTVLMYFENTRRSGGGPVEKVEMNEEEGACLIYFEDLSVLDSVLGRKHKLDNSEIQLQLFHPCMSRTIGAEKRGEFQNPESFVYKVSVHIIAFFRQVPNAKVRLEQEMSKVYGRLVVPSDNLNTLEVFPTLMSEMEGVKSLAKTWKKTAEQKLEECMKQFDCMEHQIMPDLWVSTLAQLGKIQIPNEKDVIVCTDQMHSIIRVVGLKNMVDHVSHNLKQIITDGEKELELKKQRTSDRKTLPKQQINFLSAVKFPDKVDAKYRGVKCTIQQKDDIIVFEGLLLDIKQAQLFMYETIQTMAKSSMPDYSRNKMELLAMNETCDYVRQKLEEKRCLGVWEIDGNTVIVYDESDQKANEGIQIIKKCLVEHTINIKPEQRLVISSQVWKAMVADINRQHQGYTIIHVHVQNSTIEITATDQYAGKIIETVQDFLSANALYKQTITVDSHKIRYLEQWKKPQIDEICKSQQKNMVTIDLSPGVIILQGTEKGLSEAVSRLSALLQQMCYKQTLLEKPGICKYLCSDKGEELIKHIEDINKCTIDLTNQEDDQTSQEESQLELQKHLQHPIECLSCKMLGRTMSVFHGDITDLDIHILINPCNNTLDHSAGLAKAVVEKGGAVILGECSQFKRQRLMDGDVFYTRGGNLKCKVVAHCVSPIWQGGNDNEEEYLKEVVLKSLEEADKRRLPSIGIPAIGTGIFGWPLSLATDTIIKTIQEYFLDHSKSVVRNVSLCDLDAQHVKSFIDAVKKAFPKDDVTLLEDPSQTAAKGSPSLGASPGGSQSSSLSNSNSGTLAYRIEVVKGEMARQQADVLVNTTSSSLNLRQGAVSASLLAIGGQQLQEECTKKYPKGIKPGDVAVTGAGELRCACVLHGCLPDWNDDGSTLLILKTFMKNCLSEADRMKMTSIAFPALGTGTLKYPKDVVAKEMFSTVSEFFTTNRGTSLVAFHIVVYPKDLETLTVFEKEQKQFLNRSTSPRKQDGRAKYEKKQSQGKQGYSDSFTTASNPQSMEYIQVPQLKILPGDITTFSVDAVVNPSDANVGLEGGVSQAISKKAGAELKKMCSTLGKEMKKKGYVVTPGFKLRCSCIIHVNVRDQGDGWKGIILKCLEEAVKRKLRSIAFPALGTGQVGGNPEEIGKALFEATSEISQDGSSTLQEIQMVVFQPEMVSKIQEGIKSAQESIPKTSTWWQNIKGLFGYGKETSSAQPQVLRADGMKVFIHICADSESVIQDAVDGLEKKFNKELDIDAVTDDVIKRLPEDKVSEIEKIGKKHSVTIKVEKRLGRVRIEGLLTDVGKVKTEVLSLMRGIEKMENREKQAAMLSQLVQWYYIDITKGQDLIEYPKDINATLEDAYQRKETKLKLHADIGIINIDFDALEGYPVKDPNSKVKVLRKDKIKDSGSEIPPQWGPMGKDNLMIIPLQPASKEYKDVVSAFMATVKKEVKDASFPISKIERIQNRTLYTQYQSKKKLIDEMNPGQTNEMALWHGTAEQAVASINVHGFNRSFCGKNATVYGDGVYFAKEAYYSARDTYSPLDAAGNKRMYLTKVLTGKYAKGSQGMRVPPPLVSGQPELHDSVVDDVNTPFIFVIFHDTQAYPEYLVTFKWK